MKFITKLEPNEIFVFGSNSTGFHGAGTAGQAMRGDSKNTWRADPVFLRAKAAPVGHPDRIGKWAIYGVARGFQQGHEGASYAIETIVRPAQLRSTPLSVIEAQFVELFAYAEAHPELRFLMTPVGCRYAGYSALEMKETWSRAKAKKACPANVIVPEGLYQEEPHQDLT